MPSPQQQQPPPPSSTSDAPAPPLPPPPARPADRDSSSLLPSQPPSVLMAPSSSSAGGPSAGVVLGGMEALLASNTSVTSVREDSGGSVRTHHTQIHERGGGGLGGSNGGGGKGEGDGEEYGEEEDGEEGSGKEVPLELRRCVFLTLHHPNYRCVLCGGSEDDRCVGTHIYSSHHTRSIRSHLLQLTNQSHPTFFVQKPTQTQNSPLAKLIALTMGLTIFVSCIAFVVGTMPRFE